MTSSTQKPEYHVIQTTLAMAGRWELTLDDLKATRGAVRGLWAVDPKDPAKISAVVSEAKAKWDPAMSVLMLFVDGQPLGYAVAPGADRVWFHFAVAPGAVLRGRLRSSGYTMGKSPCLWSIARSACGFANT